MTLPASGTISIGAVSTELGLSATSTRSLNDSNVRTLANKPSGTISMSDLHGKSNLTITYSGYYSGSPINGTVTNGGVYNSKESDESSFMTFESNVAVTWTSSFSGDGTPSQTPNGSNTTAFTATLTAPLYSGSIYLYVSGTWSITATPASGSPLTFTAILEAGEYES